MVNRTQALVLGFFVLVWTGLVAIFAVAPEVHEQALRLPPGGGRSAGLAFLVALSAFMPLLGVGVLRRWRWAFWLILVAFPSACYAYRRPPWNSGGCSPLPPRRGRCSARRSSACSSSLLA